MPKCLQIRIFSESTEHLLAKEGSLVAQPGPKCSEPLEQAQFGTPLATNGPRLSLGMGLGDTLDPGKGYLSVSAANGGEAPSSTLVNRLDNTLADGEPLNC